MIRRRNLVEGQRAEHLHQRMHVRRLVRPFLGCIACTFLVLSSSLIIAGDFDLMLKGGRVIDPETGLDSVRDVAIVDGRIAALGADLGPSKETIDVTGLIVAPGFIDLHSHGAFSQANHQYALYDGVTTVLELEAGAHPVSDAREPISDKAILNFGSSTGYLNARMLIKDGIIRPHFKVTGLSSFKGLWSAIRYQLGYDSQATHGQASDQEITAILQLLEEDLADGAIGIGFLLDYMSEGVSANEVKRLFEFAAKRNQVIFVHLRRPEIQGDPLGLIEIIQAAEQSGASVHIHHLVSLATKASEKFLALLRAAQTRGVDITTEIYPYQAGSTSIGANVFGRDWQKSFGITYSDIEYPVTGQRLTEARFNELRESDPSAVIIHHYRKEEWIKRVLTEDGVMVASDAMLMKDLSSRVHPRSVGTFSRVLGRYVRDQGVLTIPLAIRKMTLLPAKRLEDMVPAMKRKGRIQEGADADIIVFKADTITDLGTYKEPNQFSVGMKHVLIGGQLALRDGKQVENVTNGRLVSSRATNK
ncbi:MAG: amidohydrolase family protein [Oceanicoccus sp.]